MMAVTAETVSH